MGRYWFLATVFSLLSQVRKKAAWVEISVCRGLLVMPHPFSPPLFLLSYLLDFTTVKIKAVNFMLIYLLQIDHEISPLAISQNYSFSNLGSVYN